MAERTPRRLDFPPYALWETRAGRGTPVVLLHGLSGSSRWWSRNIDALAERHEVVAVDLVGFGKNRRWRQLAGPSFREVTALLARWLETFGEPVHLMGHSMGGQIAIRLAAERPDLIRSLVLVNATGIPFRIDPRPHVAALPKPPYGGASIARVLVPDFFRAGPAAVAAASTRIVLGDMRAMMRALDMPVLIVWGAGDPIVPVAYGEAMQREIEGSRLVVIPRAAHVAMWDAADEFNRVALEFLGEAESAPARPPRERPFSWGIAGWTNGIAHREAGRRRNVVLIHGLGMSSAYFERLACALYERGTDAIAPDIPGFGESINAPAGGADAHARVLEAWADALAIRDAVWLGHSIGCNAVAHLARMRPDIVRRAVYAGPLWTSSRQRQARLFTRLFIDAFREPLALYRHVIPSYWRTGIARWWMTWRRFMRDIGCAPPPGTYIAGERDPIPDRSCTDVVNVPGAHACVYSHPREVAEVVVGSSFRETLPSR